MMLELQLSPEEETRLEIAARSHGMDAATYVKQLILKPTSLPGEKMTVTIVKEGKVVNQGLAYLDDGTMVVVEGARRRIGETLEVVTSSVLQTVAGSMIFASIHSSHEG